ncbi:unnamed protein product [Ixodes hexagonus]
MAKGGTHQAESCPFSSGETPTSVIICAIIGIVFVVFVLLKLVISLWRGFYSCFLARWLGFTVNFRKMGEWAVITGASDGIGRAYAEELAARGLSVVLISRTLEKLEEVAKEIEKAYKVKTKVISADFTGGSEIYQVIRRELEGLEVGVLGKCFEIPTLYLLLNNVGTSYSYPEFFSAVPEGDKVMEQIIRANCLAGTMMTRICLPQMDERRRGVVINVSSISAMHPLPLLSTYAASKAYMDYLSQGLQAEYKERGVYIQSVMPAYVSTKMSKIRKASYMVPTPRTYVREALNTVGVEHATYGYLPHKFRAYVQQMLVNWLPHDVFMNISRSSLLSIRKLYYKKKGVEDVFLGKGKKAH